jgi:divalent metal cation (Fe/Co/Zn/Cd) transporter
MLIFLQQLLGFVPVAGAGLFISTVGIFLIKMAVDDAPRNEPTAGELAPGIGALAVGLFLLVLVAISVRRSWKQFRATKPGAAEATGPHDVAP